ncbi:MAG: OsmC family protein [Deltaproteobacteria bacterium]|nr:OsmC family protein [Deltaproteobacteria bacterium]
MEIASKVVWRDGMAFAAELDGHTLLLDADEEFGGQNRGPRPKGLTLVSLGGCTAMDVVAILNKMRVPLERLEVTLDSVLPDEHPKKFTKIVVRYHLWGKDLPVEKVQRAVQLSEEKYCGVRATLAPTVAMETEIYLNDERVK